MRILIQSLLLIIVASLTALGQQPAASGDSSARAKEIIKQARAAIGDEAKLSSLKSLSASGSSRRVFGEREVQTEVELDVVIPDKVRRSTTTSPFPGAEFQQIEVINGEQVWSDFISSAPMGGGGGGGDNVRFGGGGGGGGGGGFNRVGIGGPGVGGDEASRQMATRTEFTRLMLGLLAAPPAGVQVEYSYVGEAKAPDGIADVIEAKGPGDSKTRLFIDRNTHRILMLSFRAKDMRQMMRGRGGQPGGGAGGGQPRGQGGQGQGQGQAQGQGAGQPQLTPEEREKRRQEMQEAIAKLPDVDYFWRFGDYKSEGGLNLPHLITKSTGDQMNEEWQISKLKINPNIKPDRFEKKEKK